MGTLKMLGLVGGLATLGAAVPAQAHELRRGDEGYGRFERDGGFRRQRDLREGRRHEWRERELRHRRFGYGGYDLDAPMYRGW